MSLSTTKRNKLAEQAEEIARLNDHVALLSRTLRERGHHEPTCALVVNGGWPHKCTCAIARAVQGGCERRPDIEADVEVGKESARARAELFRRVGL